MGHDLLDPRISINAFLSFIHVYLLPSLEEIGYLLRSLAVHISSCHAPSASSVLFMVS